MAKTKFCISISRSPYLPYLFLSHWPTHSLTAPLSFSLSQTHPLLPPFPATVRSQRYVMFAVYMYVYVVCVCLCDVCCVYVCVCVYLCIYYVYVCIYINLCLLSFFLYCSWMPHIYILVCVCLSFCLVKRNENESRILGSLC